MKINIPEGYVIDKEKSTFEEIVFKKKDDKPRSWEEFCNARRDGTKLHIRAFYIDGGFVNETIKGGYRCKSLFYSREEAEAFLALMQLRQLRKAWVGDWDPDWKGDNCKYVIHSMHNELEAGVHANLSASLSFPTKKMAEEFLECFKYLLEQAKVLL